MANDFPEHGCAIQGIISRVVDLEAVITETTYHPDFLGSFSIKKVAPALLGEKAGYHHLEVSNGVGAMLSYQEKLNMSTRDSRKMEIRKNLLDYCKQDTLLMVHLHRWLCEQIATSAVEPWCSLFCFEASFAEARRRSEVRSFIYSLSRSCFCQINYF